MGADLVAGVDDGMLGPRLVGRVGAGAGGDGAGRGAPGPLAAEPLVSSVDYVSVADYASMEELDEVPAPGSVDVAAVISVAARVGGVRLIDNLPLR